MGKILRETARPSFTCSSASPSSAPPATTSSTSVTDTVRGSHRFKITGYALSKGIGIGKYIASDIFSVGGYDWAIYFYPDGKSVEDNATYVSLFIALASEGADVRALFELTLLDQSGKERHKVHSHFERTLESGPYTLKYRGSMWGYKRFFKRTALETSDYLKDDCLSVNCSVGVVKSHTEGPKIYKIPIMPSNIGQQLGKLLESGKGSDVSFEVNGEVFAAHKLVLAARSPVFRAQLFGPMKDQNTRCIKIEDMEAPVFKALLHVIYYDSLPDMQELTGLNSKGATTLMAQHLLAAADRYGLERVRLMCETNLCEDVAINTVATTLALAEQHHCFQLKAVCLKFVAQPENLRVLRRCVRGEKEEELLEGMPKEYYDDEWQAQQRKKTKELQRRRRQEEEEEERKMGEYREIGLRLKEYPEEDVIKARKLVASFLKVPEEVEERIEEAAEKGELTELVLMVIWNRLDLARRDEEKDAIRSLDLLYRRAETEILKREATPAMRLLNDLLIMYDGHDFEEWLKKCKKVMIDAFPHEDPFSILVPPGLESFDIDKHHGPLRPSLEDDETLLRVDFVREVDELLREVRSEKSEVQNESGFDLESVANRLKQQEKQQTIRQVEALLDLAMGLKW